MCHIIIGGSLWAQEKNQSACYYEAYIIPWRHEQHGLRCKLQYILYGLQTKILLLLQNHVSEIAISDVFWEWPWHTGIFAWKSQDWYNETITGNRICLTHLAL